MKVFVTGGHGFIGRHCCAALKTNGIDVVVPTSQALDISKPFNINGHFDAVIHLAAYNITSVGDKNEAAYQSINVQGTAHVLDGISCDHFILLSTAKIDEQQQSGYVQSKAAAETLCQKQFKGKTLTIIRSVNVLGRGQAPKAVLPVFIDLAKNNKPLVLTVNPQTPIAYIDVRDMVDLLVAVVRSPKQGIYPAAFPSLVTVNELALKVVAACHSSSKISQTVPSAPTSMLQLDCQKTWENFNFKPRYNIDQILENIISSS